MIGVSYWDFRGDYGNLSGGYNKSTCDGCGSGFSSLKYLINPFKVYIFRMFQIPDTKGKTKGFLSVLFDDRKSTCTAQRGKLRTFGPV